MTVDEVTALMRWNVAMYANCAKPLSEENAATQITIWAAELVNVPAYAGHKAMRKAFTVCKPTCAINCAAFKQSMRSLLLMHGRKFCG